MMYNVRKETNRVLEMAEDGIVSWEELAKMALEWMSEDDVEEMLIANDLIPEENEDDDDEE